MTDERRDDEIIGRALSRAIETIDVNQTPFERSRIATAPARRSIFGLWQIATAAAAVVLALAIGSWLSRPTEGQPGVAASPTPSSTVPTVGPSPSAAVATSVPTWVYFPRDGLPPVGAFVPGYAPTNAPQGAHIAERLSALRDRSAGQVPAGASNPMSLVAFNAVGGGAQTWMGVAWQGDLATVEFDVVPGWGVRGAAQSQALLEQLVYTITEEPGINRALITERGKPHAVIDQLVVDKPLSREDVFGYGAPGPSGAANSVASDGTSTPGVSLTTSYSVDSVAPGVARFVVTITGPQGAAAELPSFTVHLDRTEEADFGKAALYLQVGAEPNANLGLTRVDRSPVRAIRATRGFGSPLAVGGAAFVLGLDDLRPWRVFTLSNPTRIVVDIGGAPQSVSDRIAVYQLLPGATGTREMQIIGVARVFEASVSWRLKDTTEREVASGHFLASLGSSAVWGTFDTRIAIPASMTGPGTLELFEASAKDGTPQGVVQIPLGVR
jgi:hypothetical protein